VVFKLSPSGSETVLYSFAGGADGTNPYAGLLRDGAGNLYGTTTGGGAPQLIAPVSGIFPGPPGTRPAPAHGNGVVFELIRCDSEPSGYEFKVLYSFTGGADGAVLYAGLIRDAAGNLYGTTVYGGGSRAGSSGCGTVFKLTPTGAETMLHSFTEEDGANPQAGLIQDAAGNLYGTTSAGGVYGNGVVFKLAP
jgi:uncharacterized repeat protein (TIGR03803 family)